MTAFAAVLGAGVKAARAESARRRSLRAVTGLARFRRPALSVAALGAVTASAWLVALPLGLLVLGASLFVLEALTSD